MRLDFIIAYSIGILLLGCQRDIVKDEYYIIHFDHIGPVLVIYGAESGFDCLVLDDTARVFEIYDTLYLTNCNREKSNLFNKLHFIRGNNKSINTDAMSQLDYYLGFEYQTNRLKKEHIADSILSKIGIFYLELIPPSGFQYPNDTIETIYLKDGGLFFVVDTISNMFTGKYRINHKEFIYEQLVK